MTHKTNKSSLYGNSPRPPLLQNCQKLNAQFPQQLNVVSHKNKSFIYPFCFIFYFIIVSRSRDVVTTHCIIIINSHCCNIMSLGLFFPFPH